METNFITIKSKLLAHEINNRKISFSFIIQNYTGNLISIYEPAHA